MNWKLEDAQRNLNAHYNGVVLDQNKFHFKYSGFIALPRKKNIQGSKFTRESLQGSKKYLSSYEQCGKVIRIPTQYQP